MHMQTMVGIVDIVDKCVYCTCVDISVQDRLGYDPNLAAIETCRARGARSAIVPQEPLF